MPDQPSFLSGRAPAKNSPLMRYMPPLEEGVAAAWLAAELPVSPADVERPWVLDPFGVSPGIAEETARSGYRVLVAANNPVMRFLLELAANPPDEAELRSALADLAASYKGSERIEPHIRALYRTNCAQCGQEVEAEAFLWDRGAHAPFARIYRCPHCGDSGERPATEADAARAAHFAAGGLHRARALERVAPADDPDRPHAEEALSAYLPRAVYALFTLINKLDSFSASAASGAGRKRRLLEALLLAACDQASALWPYPTARARPRQLSIPPRFRENNVWLALEEAIGQYAAARTGSGTPVSIWPDLPPASGGICLFEGRLKDLKDSIQARNAPEFQIGAVLAGLPRPNQAFWTLSALWAGWLWGREATAPFKSVLRRRRYDWAWHATALHAALSSLAPLLKPGAEFLGLMGEAEAGFLSAAVIAAGQAGFDLQGIALRLGDDQAQITWQAQAGRAAGTGGELSPAALAALAAQAGLSYLVERGEPAGYLHLHAAALAALAHSGLPAPSILAPADILSQAQTAFQQAFSYRSGFIRYRGSEHSLEVGLWWLRNEPGEKPEGAASEAQPSGERPEDSGLALADRVEMALVRALQKQPGCTQQDLDRTLCAEFPGLLTPECELLSACLESYGLEQPPGLGRWELRPEDMPKARRSDLAAINRLLLEIGARLGYTASSPAQAPEAGPPPVLWAEKTGALKFVFYPLASAILGRAVFGASGQASPGQAAQRVIVYPGSRAGLIAYKLERDPRLALALAGGWRLVKFRHLRRLAESSRLGRDNLEAQLALDPLANRDPQMPLL